MTFHGPCDVSNVSDLASLLALGRNDLDSGIRVVSGLFENVLLRGDCSPFYAGSGCLCI